MTMGELGALVSAVASLIAGAWVLLSVAARQFDRRLEERFSAQEKARLEGRQAWEDRINKMESRYEALDLDVRKIMIELPREYVARADYVRRETVIEAKIDRLGLQLENYILKARDVK